jgi:hypothetical protein
MRKQLNVVKDKFVRLKHLRDHMEVKLQVLGLQLVAVSGLKTDGFESFRDAIGRPRWIPYYTAFDRVFTTFKLSG